MAKQPCDHCGLPTFVPDAEANAGPAGRRPVFCCTGCAFAHRLSAAPPTAGDITPLQTAAWLTGFGVFNQGVFWVLQHLLRGEGRAALSQASGYVSIGLGAVAAAVLIAGLATSRRPAAGDWVVWSLTGVGLGLALFTYSPGCAAAATLGLILWTLRGFFRRRRAPATPGKKPVEGG